MSVDAIEAKDGAPATPVPANGKSPSAFRTITEVANELDLPQHVLRFWETKFAQVRPMKRRGGRRYYRPEDVVLLREVRRLLYVDGYTIRGVQKLLRQQGRRALARPPGTPAAGEEAEGESATDAAAAVAGENAPPPPAGGSVSAEGALSTPVPSAPKWRRDMEMSTVLRKELFALLCELEELRALLPAKLSARSEEAEATEEPE
jgi:DNA-binding transcriptional MerR regulator